MSGSTAPILGIDLGTTLTRACVLHNGRYEFIVPEFAYFKRREEILFPSELMPSAFYNRPGEGVLIGERAMNHLVGGEGASEVVRWVKRSMADEKKRFRSGNAEFSPAQISAHFIRTFLRAAENQLGIQEGEITRAVVTVPAYFGHCERQQTVDAGEFHANLSRVHLLDEPVAAAIGLELHKIPGSKLVLVFDLGGGTFDVTLMRAGTDVGGGGIDELGRSGDSELGGLNWDQEIARYVATQTKGNAFKESFLDLSNVLLYDPCESAKIDLCKGNYESTTVSFRDRDRDKKVIDCVVPRAWFEQQTEKLADYCIRVCEDLFETIPRDELTWRGIKRVGWQDLDGVYLVGGGCRMPVIRKKLQERWGREPIMPDRPQHAVARGAAIYAAAKLEGRDDAQKLREFKLRSPHSTGVFWYDELNQRQFSELIKRNTRIPAKESIDFDVVGNQKSLKVEIGEKRVSLHNPEGAAVVVHKLLIDNLDTRDRRPDECVTFSVHYPNDRELHFVARFRGKEVSVRLNEKNRLPLNGQAATGS